MPGITRRLLVLAALVLGHAGAYTVQAGDTLASIARRSGVSVNQLMQQNGLRSSNIRVGQSLRLSAGQVNVKRIPALPESRVHQRGYAVYYGGRADRATRMTAAHLSLPFGTWVRVTHQRTGRSVVVKINDRGPFNGMGRIIDLSTTAARALGITSQGVAPVTLSIISRP